MKQLTLFFLLIVCIQTTAFSRQKITLQVEKRPITEILKEIEKQWECTFSFNPVLVKDMPLVSINVKEQPLEKVLEKLFAKTDILFIIQDTYIILKKRQKNITISGYIYDKQSHETLISANIFDIVSQQGAASNNFGFYSLSVPPGTVKLRPSYVGYTSDEVSVTANSDTVIHFFLKPSPLLQEIVVEGKRNDITHQAEIGKISLNSATIRSIPSFMGENDVIKALQQMPGVSAGTEGVAGMYVRGGNADENLYLVDGNPLYHINHLVGLFSTFNPEAVKTMDFYKGSFPARYGGRLSSVVDVRMNDGNMKNFNGSISVGLISSRATFEGPIVKDKTSFTISLRRTYLDLITRPLMYFANKKEKKENPETYETVDVGYYFYDFNAKITHRFSDKSRLFLSLYDGKDKLFMHHYNKRYSEYNLDHYDDPAKSTFKTHLEKTEEDVNFDMGWGTRMASLNWTYAISNTLFSNATLVYSRYASDIALKTDMRRNLTIREKESDMQLLTNTKVLSKTTYGSGIEDIGYRVEFDYMPVNNHFIRFGSSLLHHTFRPEESRILLSQENNSDKRKDTVNFANERVKVKELSLYAEDEIDFGKRLKINAGVHFSGFFVQGKSYISAQPRLSARYLLSDNWSLKASYGKMNQYVHLLQSSYISLPNDLWVPITKNIKPMVSHQISTGIFGRYGGFDVSLETYYKISHNQVEYKDGARIFSGNLNWEDRVAQGNGKAYGVEIMARKSVGKTSGWIGYTLAWAERQFPNGEINRGEVYPAKYDNRHKINIVSTHTFNKKFDLNLSWTYATGNWSTLPMGKYLDFNEDEKNYYQQRNNFKMPPYHALSVSFNYYRHKKNGRLGIWNLSVYNAYLHQNSFLVLPKEEDIYKDGDVGKGYVERKSVFKSICLFPIIPSISYTYKF